MQKPFAVNDFVINDHSGFSGLGRANSLIRSVLQGSIGLPGSGALLSQRYSRWPIVSGLNRPGLRINMTSYFIGSGRKTLRDSLLAELNPETEIAARILLADQVAPAGLVAAFGPWDLYEDDTGAWHCRELMWTDKDTVRIEGDITGGITMLDGRESRQRAIVIDAAATNRVTNPSIEVDTTSWVSSGLASMAQSNEEYKFGYYSLKCLANSANDLAYIDAAGFGAAATVTVTAWVLTTSSSVQLRVESRPGAVTSVTANASGSGDWEWLEAEITLDAGETTARVQMRDTRASGWDAYYVDGVQAEETDYPTLYLDGSLGSGYSWGGAVHASISSRVAAEFNLDDHADLLQNQDKLSFRAVVQPSIDADGNFRGQLSLIFDIRGPTAANRIYLAYHEDIDQWIVHLQGAQRLSSAVQTFSAWDWIELIVTLDFASDDYRLYIDGILVDTDTTALSTPTAFSQWNLGTSYTAGAHSGFAMAEVDVWTRALTANEVAQLFANGTSHGRARYIEALCEASQPLVLQGTETNRGNVSTLAVNGEVRIRSNDGDFINMQCVDDVWEMPIVVDSDDRVRPIIRITPDIAKDAGTGFTYRRAVLVEWKAPSSAPQYPVVAVFDTATPIPAKMQADGDDLRVYVDGLEVDRWLNAINTANTDVWFNLNFKAHQEYGLRTAIAGAGAIAEIDIDLDDDISILPSSGLVLIDSEVFVYLGKNNADRTLTGVTRAMRGTAAAAHTTADVVKWIQHDVWIVYGDSSLSAPVVDDDFAPAFRTDSTNDSWDYDAFGDENLLRSGIWKREIVNSFEFANTDEDSQFLFSTADAFSLADPWIGMGILIEHYRGGTAPAAIGENTGRWKINNVCGIVTITVGAVTTSSVAEKDVGEFNSHQIQSSEDGVIWANESGWGAGAQALDANGLDKWAAFYLSLTSQIDWHEDSEWQLGKRHTDITLTLYNTLTPDTTVQAEETAYQISGVLTNQATGEALNVNFIMDEDDILEIDAVNGTVRHLADGTRQDQAVSQVGGTEREWLELLPATNIMKWDDTGTNKVDILFEWYRRYWE